MEPASPAKIFDSELALAPPPPPRGLRDDRIPGTDQAVRGGRHGHKLHSGSPPRQGDARRSTKYGCLLVIAEGSRANRRRHRLTEPTTKALCQPAPPPKTKQGRLSPLVPHNNDVYVCVCVLSILGAVVARAHARAAWRPNAVPLVPRGSPQTVPPVPFCPAKRWLQVLSGAFPTTSSSAPSRGPARCPRPPGGFPPTEQVLAQGHARRPPLPRYNRTPPPPKKRRQTSSSVVHCAMPRALNTVPLHGRKGWERRTPGRLPQRRGWRLAAASPGFQCVVLSPGGCVEEFPFGCTFGKSVVWGTVTGWHVPCRAGAQGIPTPQSVRTRSNTAVHVVAHCAAHTEWTAPPRWVGFPLSYPCTMPHPPLTLYRGLISAHALFITRSFLRNIAPHLALKLLVTRHIDT